LLLQEADTENEVCASSKTQEEWRCLALKII